MIFFNLDLHVSVIEDVAWNIRHLGHDVDSHLLSGHHWVCKKPRASFGTGPGRDGRVGYRSLNLTSWHGFFDDAPGFARAAAWRAECPELGSYDGFVATYPPAFALLYEGLPGPTVCVLPIRYELPFTDRPEAWAALNDHLVRGVEARRIAVVANSRYDAAYYEYFTGQPAVYISSTCEYAGKLAPRWDAGLCDPGLPLLAFGDAPGCRAAQEAVPEVRFVRDVFPRGYEHAQIARAGGIVWIPYNCSIMSFFEHVRLGIPVFVPSQRFLLELARSGLALSQLSWHGSLTAGSRLPPARAGFLPDPHTREGVEAWLPLHDFYNREEFPHVVEFDSWRDLREQARSADRASLSRQMLLDNSARQKRNLSAWENVLRGLGTS